MPTCVSLESCRPTLISSRCPVHSRAVTRTIRADRTGFSTWGREPHRDMESSISEAVIRYTNICKPLDKSTTCWITITTRQLSLVQRDSRLRGRLMPGHFRRLTETFRSYPRRFMRRVLPLGHGEV